MHDQAELFGTLGAEGFVYRDGVVPPEEARALLDWLGGLTFRPFEFRGYLGRRRVVSFGGRYDFTAEALREGEPIPDFLLPARARAAAFAGVPAESLRQVLINEYAPGAGVGWHRDKGMFGDVIGISLGSACMLRLRRARGDGWERAGQEVRPGSAYLLRGPARWEWEHSVPPVRRLRYSVTFRNFVEASKGSPAPPA
jgi:alkylated DNA repair dioxygenase AlkB